MEERMVIALVAGISAMVFLIWRDGNLRDCWETLRLPLGLAILILVVAEWIVNY